MCVEGKSSAQHRESAQRGEHLSKQRPSADPPLSETLAPVSSTHEEILPDAKFLVAQGRISEVQQEVKKYQVKQVEKSHPSTEKGHTKEWTTLEWSGIWRTNL